MELTTINGTITIDLDTITLDDINDIISKFSVEGPTGAKTVLYSGTLGGCSTNTIVKNMSDVRIIDNTELGLFLADNSKDSQFKKMLKIAMRNEITSGIFDINKVEKGLYASELEMLSRLLVNQSELYGESLEKAIKLASKGYTYEPTQGAWAIASKRFIEETPTNSEIICITAEANNTRTWAAVEVPTALDKLPDEQKFGGYTVAELRQIRDSEGIEKVVDILKQESAKITDDIQMYYDKDGSLITTDSSSITGGSAVEIPKETAFSTTMGDIRNYADGKYMSSICPEYDNLTDLQKLQLKQIELDARNHNYSKLQQTISGDTTGSVGDVRIVYDVEGNVTGIDMSGIREGSAISTEGSSAVFDISSDGSTKVCLDSSSGTRAWWRNETKRNIRVKLKKVNYNISLAA